MGIEEKLIQEMIRFDQGDPKRIQHFLKVYEFASLIGTLENVDEQTLKTLRMAAIVHDIGICYCEKKFGRCDGKMQEQYGPNLAKELLQNLQVEEPVVQRICYLVGHHHTYTNISGVDYQILVEADFLVNLYEDEVNEEGIGHAYHHIFQTKAGKEICRTMYGLKE